MPTQKTLVCNICGKEWRNSKPHCESADDKKHSFSVLNISRDENPTGNTLVCTICGQEWPDTEPQCEIADSKKHNFTEVETMDI